MNEQGRFDRRGFLKVVGGAVATAGLASPAPCQESLQSPQAAPGKVKLTKAVKLNMIAGDMSILDKFKLLKDIGFDGVEMNGERPDNRDEVVAARDKVGLPIHGVVGRMGWKKPLTHADPAVREEGLEGLKIDLVDAKFYGATSVLLVPGKVDETMPYDKAYTRAHAEIRKAVPLAEKLGIRILIENVWNNFLLSPLEMARFIDELDSPMVGSYFDVGNVVRSGWPEQWIRILGKRIVKLDIKEYSRKKRDNEGLWKGFEVEIGDGDCNWPAVMQALRDIGFSGWATAEVPGGDRARLTDIAARMDRVFAT